jgi:hypothetical protein
MKYFTDRIFYLERTDALVHITFLSLGRWALHRLGSDGEWVVDGMATTYEALANRTWGDTPTLLLQEEW